MRISVNWLAAVQQRGAQVLCRLAAGCFTQRSRTLSDGSYLVTLRPKGQIPLILRVIEYRLHPLVAHDLALLPVSRTCRRADPTGVHRLVTTLLDPLQAPACELISLYHERWEIELVIAEVKIQQRLSPQPLRSKSPELLYQELYGLLLAHYAVRAWMHQSARQADLDPDCLSFTMPSMCWTPPAMSSPSSRLTSCPACKSACEPSCGSPRRGFLPVACASAPASS